MVLSVFIKFQCILHYYKYKVKYIELRVMKVVLITFIIKKSN